MMSSRYVLVGRKGFRPASVAVRFAHTLRKLNLARLPEIEQELTSYWITYSQKNSRRFTLKRLEERREQVFGKQC